MAFGILGRAGPGMTQVLGYGIGPREGVLLGTNLGRAIVSDGGFTAYVCNSAVTRRSSQITLGRLVHIVTVIIIFTPNGSEHRQQTTVPSGVTRHDFYMYTGY